MLRDEYNHLGCDGGVACLVGPDSGWWAACSDALTWSWISAHSAGLVGLSWWRNVPVLSQKYSLLKMRVPSVAVGLFLLVFSIQAH